MREEIPFAVSLTCIFEAVTDTKSATISAASVVSILNQLSSIFGTALFVFLKGKVFVYVLSPKFCK